MSIIFDAERKIFKLDTVGSSYAMMIESNGYIAHLYYGKKVESTDLSYLYLPQQRAFSPNLAEYGDPESRDVVAQEFSTNGIGDFRIASAVIRDDAGHVAVGARYESHRIVTGKPGLTGLPATFGQDDEVETLEITCFDPILKVAFVLSYSVFADVDAIARSVRVVNRGTDTVAIEKISSCMVDFPEGKYDVVSFNGAWARERYFERHPVGHGIFTISSTRGLSSHQRNPFFMLCESGATEESGEVFGQALLYSGNFAAEIERDQFDNVRTQFGINPEFFEWQLGAGQEFQAPEVVMVYSGEGFGAMSRTYHDLFRKHLIRSWWRDKKRPILVNNWEATYFDFNAEKLLSIAKDAAKLGIEMLVLDDGWFGKRDNDYSGLGDWFVNEKKLAGGFARLVKGVNDLGLKFGLWFEPEMVSRDSRLYEAHPDWCLHIPGRPQTEGRHQLVLDMSRPEVVDYLFEAICKILDSANIEYIKWDANRHLTEVGSAVMPAERQREVFHRYVLGMYELHERLLERYPKLLIEGCSGGGGRFDAGMLYYVPQIWTTDDTDAIERLRVQYGTSFGYPCSAMGAHVSDCPNHQTGRTTSFETRGNVALAGTFGYELDLNKMGEEEREWIRKQVALYHRVNPIVAQGDYYRLTSPFTDQVTAWMSVSKDKREAVLTAVFAVGMPNPVRSRLRLRGLEAGATYECDGKSYRGDVLMNAGYPLDLCMSDGYSMLKIFEVK